MLGAVAVRPAVIAERDDIIDLASDVFFHDPRYSVIRDDAARRTCARLDLSLAVRSYWSRATTLVAVDQRGLCGVSMYLPPEFRGPSLLSTIGPSFAWLAQVSLSHYVRRVSVGNRFNASRTRDPHFYLLIIAVHPRAQGSGLGSRLMQPLIERAGEARKPIQLHTSNVRNHGFYQRLGFRSADSFEMLENIRVDALQRD